MNLNKQESHAVFIALLHKPFIIGGSEKLLQKLLKEYPEFQKMVDRKVAQQKRIDAFSLKVLGK
jgi:hypothetical protein